MKRFIDGTSPYQHLLKPLNDLVPVEGKVPMPFANKALERFRRASNVYWDLHHEDLANESKEVWPVFRIKVMEYRGDMKYGTYDQYHMDLLRLADAIEPVMLEIVVNAYYEQILKGRVRPVELPHLTQLAHPCYNSVS